MLTSQVNLLPARQDGNAAVACAAMVDNSDDDVDASDLRLPLRNSQYHSEHEDMEEEMHTDVVWHPLADCEIELQTSRTVTVFYVCSHVTIERLQSTMAGIHLSLLPKLASFRRAGRFLWV